MKLYYEKAEHEDLFIGDCSDFEDASEKMVQFLSQRGINGLGHYWRWNEFDTGFEIDFGSWTEFFRLEKEI